MPVYVDNVFIPADVPNGRVVHSSKWCHLVADTSEELIALAVKIGLRPGYIQHPGTVHEHFDVTEGKRWQAIRAGAIQIDWTELAELDTAKREGRPFDLAVLRASKEQSDE